MCIIIQSFYMQFLISKAKYLRTLVINCLQCKTCVNHDVQLLMQRKFEKKCKYFMQMFSLIYNYGLKILKDIE